MKQTLQRIEDELYHYVGDKKISGQNDKMRGDCSGLSGNCSGLRGNCSGLTGDLEDCEITDEERSKGVLITDLIQKL